MKTPKFLSSVADYFRNHFDREGQPMSRSDTILLIVVVLFVLAFIFGLVFILLPFLIQALWGWIVPDLFVTSVLQGYLPGAISWSTAFKILVVLLVVGAILNAGKFQATYNTGKDRKEKEKAALPANETPIGDVVQAAVRDTAAIHVFPVLVDPLTDRELEVLQLLTKGLTNQQIALQIKVSESTVVYHIGHIFGKLRVNSRVEAAVWAKERGII